MSNPNTFVVPTCGRPAYNLLSPYDSDLKTAFESKETTNFTNEVKNTCTAECKGKDLQGLKYTDDLYNCSVCMGLNSTGTSNITKPTLASAWGCTSCYSVIAPIGYYKNTVSDRTTSPNTVTPADITKYFTDTTYKTGVDTSWTNANQLSKGDTVRHYCVENPSFTMASPPPVDCEQELGEWGPCINGIQTRDFTNIITPSNGGAPCNTEHTRTCSSPDNTFPTWGIIVIIVVCVFIVAVIIFSVRRFTRFRRPLIANEDVKNWSEIKIEIPPEKPSSTWSRLWSSFLKMITPLRPNFKNLDYKLVGFIKVKDENHPVRPYFCAHDPKTNMVHCCYDKGENFSVDAKSLDLPDDLSNMRREIMKGTYSSLEKYIENRQNKDRHNFHVRDLNNYQNPLDQLKVLDKPVR